ncbi:hypothetical protein [Paracoccus sp. (in: a-proteobacteria)]|uniref:hypothetical protein n=1 Tax=Paracoccus sp. TaxID=267 RepID=UPI0026DEED27|nr:hypothetical protein [Paracoccus sp. (in: a-proteobacteria)]MDO5646482.1 hypothetical protein [Paracoccus sp. (in: a-proteobacteria)]
MDCTPGQDCINWQVGAGFRPAVWATDDDALQCPLLAAGDDTPLAGKMAAGWHDTELVFNLFDPTPGVLSAVPGGPVWQPAGGSPNGATPGPGAIIPPSLPPATYPGGTPATPDAPLIPLIPVQPPEDIPDLPAPVPLPDSGALLISVLAASFVLRRFRRG